MRVWLTGENRMLVENRDGVGLIKKSLGSLVPHGSEAHVAQFGLHPSQKNPTDEDGLLVKHQLSPPFPL